MLKYFVAFTVTDDEGCITHDNTSLTMPSTVNSIGTIKAMEEAIAGQLEVDTECVCIMNWRHFEDD